MKNLVNFKEPPNSENFKTTENFQENPPQFLAYPIGMKFGNADKKHQTP